jgi:hypothetical protein
MLLHLNDAAAKDLYLFYRGKSITAFEMEILENSAIRLAVNSEDVRDIDDNPWTVTTLNSRFFDHKDWTKIAKTRGLSRAKTIGAVRRLVKGLSLAQGGYLWHTVPARTVTPELPFYFAGLPMTVILDIVRELPAVKTVGDLKSFRSMLKRADYNIAHMFVTNRLVDLGLLDKASKIPSELIRYDSYVERIRDAETMSGEFNFSGTAVKRLYQQATKTMPANQGYYEYLGKENVLRLNYGHVGTIMPFDTRLAFREHFEKGTSFVKLAEKTGYDKSLLRTVVQSVARNSFKPASIFTPALNNHALNFAFWTERVYGADSGDDFTRLGLPVEVCEVIVYALGRWDVTIGTVRETAFDQQFRTKYPFAYYYIHQALEGTGYDIADQLTDRDTPFVCKQSLSECHSVVRSAMIHENVNWYQAAPKHIRP